MGVRLQEFLAELEADKAAAAAEALAADEIEDQKALKAKDEQITARNAKIADLEAVIDERDEQIEKLQARIDELEDGTPAPQPEPEPTPEPEQPEPPVSTPAWPKSHNTGVKPGVPRTNYTGGTIITKAGTVIENKNISVGLVIAADDVTLRNCKFTATNVYHQVLCDWMYKKCIIEDCEFAGEGSSGMHAINNVSDGGVVRRCNIHGMVIGVRFGPRSIIEDNYIHDLAEKSKDPDKRHFDGVVMMDGDGAVVRRNAIIMPPNPGGTAAVFLASQFGSMSNIQVRNNLLMGGASYAAYATASGHPMSGVVFDGNYIEKAVYGYITQNSNAQDTNNVKWDSKTQAIPAPVKAWLATA